MKRVAWLLGIVALFLQGCGGQDPDGTGLDGDKGDSTLAVGRSYVTLPANARLRISLPLAAGQTVAVVVQSLSQPALNTYLWLDDGRGQTLVESNLNGWQAALPMAAFSDSFIVFRAAKQDSYIFQCKNLSSALGDFQIDVIALEQLPPVDLTVTNASIRGIFDRLRQGELQLTANTSLQLSSEPVDLFERELISEGADGLLQETGAALERLESRATLRSLVAATNTDRQMLFAALAAASDQASSAEQIGRSLSEIYRSLRRR